VSALCNTNTLCTLAGVVWAVAGGARMWHEDVRVVGGVGGFEGTGLFSWEGALVLPLPVSSLAVPLTPLEIGHWCCFLALQDMNFCLQALHCQCGWPSSASLAAFQLSHLDVQFLLHARTSPIEQL
jgi:hypothetical protein